MLSVLSKIFDSNKRDLKRLERIADQVEALLQKWNNFLMKI